MIEILSTATIDTENLTLFGSLDEKEQNISLRFPMVGLSYEKIRDIIYQRATDFSVLDMKGNAYSVYGCKFSGNTIHFASGAISNIVGNFSRVIMEPQMSQSYDSVSFSFKDMHKFFPLEAFITSMGKNEDEYSINKGESKTISIVLSNGIVISVKSTYKGTYKSSELFNLDISQSKIMTIVFPNKCSVDTMLTTVAHVKQYFEFVCNQELLLEEVYFSNVDDKHRLNKLISDPILKPKTYIKNIKDNPYNGEPKELLKGLECWLAFLKNYDMVFNIWEKTIYNVNIDPEDLFIWYCQAFELICTLRPEIYTDAKKRMAKKQSEPNLKNFMQATNALYGITTQLDAQYFADVKIVRDKLTHHNPKKVVSKEQKTNSYNLIKYFWISLLTKLLNISGISNLLCLTAHSKY